MSTTFWTVFLAILAYTTLNVGLVLEKRGAVELPAIETAGVGRSLRSFIRNPWWLTGFLLTNVQLVPLFAALSLGPLSLVAPMTGVGLVVLAGLSVAFLREPFSRWMALGITLTVAGIAVLGAASPGEASPLSWSAALGRVSTPGALAWLGGLGLGVVLPVALCVRMRFRAADVAFGVASGFAATIALVASKVMAAGFGPGEPANSLGDNLGRWPVYVLLLLLLAGNAGAAVLQQVGFQKGKAMVLVPLYTVGTVVLPALTGVVLFDEWERLDASLVAVNVTALAVLLAGVGVLSCFGSAPAHAPGPEAEAPVTPRAPASS